MRTFLRSALLVLILAVASASLLLAGYLLQPLTAQASAKWIGLFAALYLGLAGLAWVQARFWIAPLWKAAPKRLRVTWAASAALLGMACFALLTPAGLPVLEKFPVFAPLEQVEVRVALEDGETVTIERIKVNNRQVAPSSLTLQGNWQPDGLAWRTADATASVVLRERIPHSVEIAFLRSPGAGQVVVTWAGQQEQIDLRSSTVQGAIYTFSFDRAALPAMTVVLRLLTLPGWLGAALAACGALFASRLNFGKG